MHYGMIESNETLQRKQHIVFHTANKQHTPCKSGQKYNNTYGILDDRHYLPLQDYILQCVSTIKGCFFQMGLHLHML